MLRASLTAIICLAAGLSGCGGQSPALPPAPPHGGTAFPLPEGKGFAEVLRQDAPDHAGRSSRGPADQSVNGAASIKSQKLGGL